MNLSNKEKRALENQKLILEVRNKRLDNFRLAIQIPLTAMLLITAVITLIKYF